MEQIRDRVAGLDIHRDTVVAYTRIGGSTDIELTKKTTPTTLRRSGPIGIVLIRGRTNNDSDGGNRHLPQAGVLRLGGIDLWLCNAQRTKNLPERKTDLSDAEWLGDVARHGMVRPSMVPPSEIRALRDLTRYRKSQVDTPTKEIQRLGKVFQDAQHQDHLGSFSYMERIVEGDHRGTYLRNT
ncbi:IS110 family transposase [Acidithrix ferrooxidans]|uniref:Transposase n=1 Tax=Acidithrix ferrooxidans TaxID=1280514 RepID=A0A0D8HDZ4_9ACTN|nr:transposase [Acidithrix ferrooxidans]KJF16180.1 transposase [Acidithrix ferrooxidans]